MGPSPRSSTGAPVRLDAGTRVVMLLGGALASLAMVGINSVLPAIDSALARSPEDSLLVKQLMGVIGLAMMAGAVLAGFVVERVAVRSILLVCALVYVAAGTAGLYLSDLRFLLGSRLLLGLSAATIQITAFTLINTRLEGTERARWMGMHISAAMVCTIFVQPIALQGVPGNAAAAGTTLYNFARSGRYRYREDREQSIFGNLTLHLGDRTEISGGLRHIWFKADSGLKASSNVTTAPETWSDVASVRRCFGHSSVPGCQDTKTATIYSASAKHNFTEELMAYASYGTSWRPGNSVVGFAGAAVDPFLSEFLNLPDEDSESFEVGIKSSWLDNRLRFNISGYYQKFTNFPFRVSTPIISISTSPTLTPATPAVTAAPGFNFVAPVPVEVKGFEADLAFDVTPRFNISASVSYADGKIKNGVFPCHDLNDDNIADSIAPSAGALYAHVGDRQIDTCTANARSSNAAPWSGMIQAEYRHPIDDLGEGFVRGFANWKGRAEGDSINPIDQVRSYALIDLFGGIRDPNGNWEVTAFVKNVMNTRRVLTREANPLVTNLVPNQNLTPFGGTGTSIPSSSATNYLAISTIAPREFGLSLRFAFGSR